MAAKRVLKFDEIGYWSEVKLAIVKEYAAAYSNILTAQTKPKLHHVYVDAFAGAGAHLSKTTGDMVPGSPLNALEIKPPFTEHHLIDLDGTKVKNLRALVGERGDVCVHEGDCNKLLLKTVFPRIRYEDFRRALCLLDPYGLSLTSEVVERAGKMKSIEIFLNFPIMDMNRNALWSNSSGVPEEEADRMTTFWGDESWKQAAYAEQPTLFGGSDSVKYGGNERIVQAYRDRLRKVAGFKFVPEPMPMRNTRGAVVPADPSPADAGAATAVEEAHDDFCQLDERFIPQGRDERLHPSSIRRDVQSRLASLPGAHQTGRSSCTARRRVTLASQRLDGDKRRERQIFVSNRRSAANPRSCQVPLVGTTARTAAEARPGWYPLGDRWGRVRPTRAGHETRVGRRHP